MGNRVTIAPATIVSLLLDIGNIITEELSVYRCAFQGSNLGPFEYQSNALPTELNALSAIE